MMLRNGYGYYLIDAYPIGGCFRRAGTHGLEIAEIEETWTKPCHGCNARGTTADGHKVAFHTAHLDRAVAPVETEEVGVV